MKFSKKILTILISFGFIINISLAENDCQKFGIQPYIWDWFDIVNNARKIDWERLGKIIDKDSINTAILNLKKYCCDNNLINFGKKSNLCIEENKYFNSNALDSPYLFDHLFDVTMRRLSWLTWKNDIYTQTKMKVDQKWTERRQRINNKAQSISWNNPQEIINKYKEFRSQTQKYDIKNNIHNVFLEKNGNEFWSYIKWKSWPESQKIHEALTKYEDRTLYDRYNNACALSEIFYTFLSSEYSDDVNVIRKLNNECSKITASQISSEVEYTSLVIKRSSNLFLSNYLNGYISYLESRTNNLKSIRKDSTNKFLDIVRGVSMLTDTCTKW